MISKIINNVPIRVNTQNIISSIIIDSDKNASVIGPITVDSGVNIRFKDGDSTNEMGIGAEGNDFIVTAASGGERLRVTSHGNVGIGTSSPSGILTVNGTTRIDLDTTDTTNGISIGTANANVPIKIGNTVSTVTINDDLQVVGNLLVQGSTTTIDTTNLKISDSLINILPIPCDENSFLTANAWISEQKSGA